MEVAGKLAKTDQSVDMLSEGSVGMEHMRSMLGKVEGYRTPEKIGQVRYIEMYHGRAYGEREGMMGVLGRVKQVVREGVEEFPKMDFEGRKSLEARVKAYRRGEFLPAWQSCKHSFASLLDREFFRHLKPSSPLLLKTTLLILKI